jgi:hypothetical protein
MFRIDIDKLVSEGRRVEESIYNLRDVIKKTPSIPLIRKENLEESRYVRQTKIKNTNP